MTIITDSELKTELDILGIDYSDYEENLQQLLNSTITKLEGLTGVNINPKVIKEVVFDFKSKMFQCKQYPVLQINSFMIGGKCLLDDNPVYILDDGLGVIYLPYKMYGLLEIEYTNQVPDDIITSLVNPLLVDMIAHGISKGFNFDGEYNTVKEGDVSVSYDTSTGLYQGIQDRINKLGQMYSGRAILL